MPKSAAHRPLTAHAHLPMACGYAPRTLHLATDRGTLFVGSKDGSITAMTRKGQDYDASPVRPGAGSGSGVRALCEWQSGWLWVGRRNGEVELIDLSTPSKLHPMVPASRDSVRSLGRIDAERSFLSFQRGGTWVLPRRTIARGRVKPVLQEIVAEHRPLQLNGEALCGLLFIVAFRGRNDRFFVAANTLGQIFVWDGEDTGSVRKANPWQDGRSPGFINDFSVLWQDERQTARGVLLATDRGVHLLHATTRHGKDHLACRPLSLPGLGTVCMAITYVEPEDRGIGYLWAADSRGDGHLFTARANETPASIGFSSSGHIHADSQSMLATSWYRQEGPCLVICQVRRNDQIVLTEYREVATSRPENSTEKVRKLLSHGDRAEIDRFWRDREPASWPSYAKLSELFEHLAEKPATLEVLLEFLGDPSPQAAWRILQQLRRGADPEHECRRAVQLWVLSLVGVINRTGGKLKESQRESAYLGIIRWLRQLLELAAAEHDCPFLAEELEIGIRMVRKWGLFGEANARRDNLIRPLAVLRKQPGPEEALDLLTYETLLFERGVDLRVEDRSGALPGRNAWDLSGETLWGRYHFAVSWHWGWVDVYELEQEPGSEPELKKRGSFPAQGGRQRQMDEAPRSQYGHSRAVLLGKLSVGGRERAYLLTSPARPRGGTIREMLLIRELPEHGEIDRARPAGIELPQGESLYSLLDLGSGWVLAGLSGSGNKPLCYLGRIEEGPEGSLVMGRWQSCQDDSASAPYPDSKRNRVWCLTRVEPREAEMLLEILVGCEDGSIYRLEILPHDGTRWTSRWTLVARMNSAVKALVCRRIGGSALRIVSGSSSGSIVAWQELEPETFVSLWAADEGEQIAGLHLLDIPETDGTLSPMVLGVTRDERFVLFNDCDVIVASPPRRRPGRKPRPLRIPVPGCRHGTLQRARREQASAFASCLVPEGPAGLGPDEGGTGRVAVVLTASKHGVLRLLSIHYPHFQSLRKEKFEKILEDWRAVVQGDHQLRLVHAAYRTAPSLELILVRWLLDPAWPDGAPKPSQDLEPWMLPRNLRPLLRLRKAWEGSYGAETSSEIKRHRKDTYQSLLAALREAFRLNDLLLYQEICEVALQRGNWDLFTYARRPADPLSQNATEIYLRVFKAVEESLQQWRGSVNGEERLARMNVARNMVDGDTAFRLFEAAASSGRAAHFRKVLARRIGGVRDLVVKGDSTATLEALRAANLSLLRLCKRLTDRRNSPKGRKRAEIAWEKGLEPYFSELAVAAARALRSSFKLGDVVEHGYARTFALAVCACPSAALRIATRLTETRLISDPDADDDLSRLIPRQFEILHQIGIDVPDHARELFGIGAKPPRGTLDPMQDRFLVNAGKGRKGGTPIPPRGLWRDFGAENARDLACLWRVHGLVNWFSRLEQVFSREPEGISGAWKELGDVFGAFCHDEVKHLYGHSYAFWCASIHRFARLLLEEPGAEAEEGEEERACRILLHRLAERLTQSEPGAPLQPETVLLSRKVAAWAHDTGLDLNRRYKDLEIFQPEYSIFREVLARLERSAEKFDQSAAVRMNLVQGVLGHHLLEDLDEHLLELQEIAHVLDPLLVRDYRRDRRSWPRDTPRSESVAQRFAHYLMTRSARAESLPENLRTLLSLLTTAGAQAKTPRTLGDLLGHFSEREPARWEPIHYGEPGREHPISGEEFRHLDLVLKELNLNDEKHPRYEEQGDPSSTVSSRVCFIAGTNLQIRITFKFLTTESERDELDRLRAARWSRSSRIPRENLGRLWSLMQQGLQAPIVPRPDRAVASSGMGLYVANFAAAIVKWKLDIASVSHADLLGECVFTLTQLERTKVEKDAASS